jgi:ABC-type Mn2+/Zn2+ transport system ATPase subunit
MSGTTLLETRDLALEYGSHAVVADPNTVVRPGEIVGLLGANGVGETTTLLGLVGELKPVSGYVSLFGVEQGIHCTIGTAAGLASYRRSGQLSVHYLFSMTCTWDVVTSNRRSKNSNRLEM